MTLCASSPPASLTALLTAQLDSQLNSQLKSARGTAQLTAQLNPTVCQSFQSASLVSLVVLSVPQSFQFCQSCQSELWKLISLLVDCCVLFVSLALFLCRFTFYVLLLFFYRGKLQHIYNSNALPVPMLRQVENAPN